MDGEKTEAVQVIDKRASTMAAAPVGSTPSDLIRVALERGATIEQMGQLIALQERMEATEARKAFIVAMAGFKAEPISITKDGEVDFKTDKGRTHYRHETLANVLRAVTPRLAAHGLSVGWVTKQDPKSGDITVDCVVTHLAGHAEVVTLTGPPDKSGNKNALQAIESAVSYLKRYTVLAALGLASEDEDDDAGGGAKTRKQAAAKVETTAEQGTDSRGLPDRAAKTIAWFQTALGIEQAQLERALKLPATSWVDADFRHLSEARKKLGELALADRAKVAAEWFPASAEVEQPPPREPGEEG